jgi:hypothetical protein
MDMEIYLLMKEKALNTWLEIDMVSTGPGRQLLLNHDHDIWIFMYIFL